MEKDLNINEFMEKFIPQFEKKGIVVFTGAGLSTASGIKDFRGENGLYKENINAETILSHNYFINHPEEFYDFFRNNLLNNNVKPNLAHKVIAELEHLGYVNTIITQNIDGLDLLAGSNNVIEIHGNATKFYCTGCKKEYSLEDINNMEMVPKCTNCNSIIRPDIVLYDEQLDGYNLMSAKTTVSYATTLLVIGSSLKVNPAARLVHDFLVDARFDKNKKLFIINKGETDYDGFVKDSKYDGDVIEFAKTLKKFINH